MIQIRKVLVPTDFSEPSDKAVAVRDPEHDFVAPEK